MFPRDGCGRSPAVLDFYLSIEDFGGPPIQIAGDLRESLSFAYRRSTAFLGFHLLRKDIDLSSGGVFTEQIEVLESRERHLHSSFCQCLLIAVGLVEVLKGQDEL
jgi:hypothetical protein